MMFEARKDLSGPPWRKSSIDYFKNWMDHISESEARNYIYEIFSRSKFEYNQLINKVEVLVWNEEESKTDFEKVSNIKMLHGTFETYTILDLENGNNFIANGFITRPY